MSTPVSSGKILQILHTGVDHLVLASNINCGIGKVNLYNSLYTVVSSETRILVEKVFGYATIILPPCAKQSGGCDCGLFAVAFCTGLVHGFDVSTVAFTQQAMRNHLMKCFEQLEMVPFPATM